MQKIYVKVTTYKKTPLKKRCCIGKIFCVLNNCVYLCCVIEREIKERESNTELMPEMPIILIEKYKFRESRKKQLKKVICCFEIKAVIYPF